MKPPRQVAKPSRKLKSGTTARAVSEWVGKSPDEWPPPPRVRLRIILRQGGKCAITGRKFGPKARPQFDHVVALADGGQNREQNIRAILAEPHAAKSAAEGTERARVRARQKTQLGVKDAPARKIQSKGFPPGAQEQKRDKDRLPQARGLTPLMRQLGMTKKDLE